MKLIVAALLAMFFILIFIFILYMIVSKVTSEVESATKPFDESLSDARRFHAEPYLDFTLPDVTTEIYPENIFETSKGDVQMLSMLETLTVNEENGEELILRCIPKSIKYNVSRWNPWTKLKVFLVPNFHNDPGWSLTSNKIYENSTQVIFENMLNRLQEEAGRKFIWAEIYFLSLWWKSDATSSQKDSFRKLLESGNIEIVTGGWVMNDEANSHWLSTIQQLTTGHQWLIDHFGYIPKNSWSIDSFGHSSSQAYLLKLAGAENSVIRRVHYEVTKQLSLKRQLVFKWRQLWDTTGKTDIFTNLVPFDTNFLTSSCGAEIREFSPFQNTESLLLSKTDVTERALAILDQWRIRAQMYRSNVILIPVSGDVDIKSKEKWGVLYKQYEVLNNYINKNQQLFTEVQFGTLQDYFTALHNEVNLTDYPMLTGDFFTYADKRSEYWSGCYTSRPFYKNMERVLLGYVRAAETITAQAVVSKSLDVTIWKQMRQHVEASRRALAVFQHHDTITGTSKEDVVKDHAKRMLKAIKACQLIIQRAAFNVLKKPPVLGQRHPNIHFIIDDLWWSHNQLPTKILITLNSQSPTRRIVLYNALSFRRQEIFTVLVSTPDVYVLDPKGSFIRAQLSLVMGTGEDSMKLATDKFQLSFEVIVEPLALTTYTVSLRDNTTDGSVNEYIYFARTRIYNLDRLPVGLPHSFYVEKQNVPSEDLPVGCTAYNTTKLIIQNGLVRAIVAADGITVPVNMRFVKYETSDSYREAHVFVPKGSAEELPPSLSTPVIVTEGPLKATVYSIQNVPGLIEIALVVSLYNNPSLPHSEVEISNTLLIEPKVVDLEVAMRFSTGVKNRDVFYTDVNGMQMIKRRHFDNIPIQGNFYPFPSSAYIEDDATRFTILTSTPLGVAALQPGQIEIMQDRKLNRDDNRGVADNVRTRHTFRLIVENVRVKNPCMGKPSQAELYGRLTLGAHVSQQTLLQPLIAMQYPSREDTERPHFTPTLSSAADLVLASFRAGVSAKMDNGSLVQGIGMTFQWSSLDKCYGKAELAEWYPLGNGLVSITKFLEAAPEEIYESSLTFVHLRQTLPEGVLTLRPMEISSVFVVGMGDYD